MKISACLLLQIVILFSGNLCWAQQERTDSLKKVLPALKDSARINNLNELSKAYCEVNLDFASSYAGLALQEGKKINYSPGKSCFS